MAWPEVLIAQKEKRHEIVLSGIEISERLKKGGLDHTIFEVSALNYLNIHETILSDVPDDIHKLVNLQTLVLHSNKIEQLTANVSQLAKLKVLDLSRNCLKEITSGLLELPLLSTLNVSDNQLETFPHVVKKSKLSVLELSNNKLQDFSNICCPEMDNLLELRLSNNCIEVISEKIVSLTSLKVLCLNANQIKVIPGELPDCSKLKEINLKDNPITDKRLLKLINQCHAKQVLDYVKQHCSRTSPGNAKAAKKGKKSSNKQTTDEANVEEIRKRSTYKITVQHFTNDSLRIVLKDEVAQVRPYMVACLVLDFKFTEDTFKQFIQLQTKLHDTMCDKRNAATIATHDLNKLAEGDLTYTAMSPGELRIKPLNQTQVFTGVQLFSKLQTEAENLRKEKKRNVYSGIHKYLYLLEGKPKYPCLVASNDEVVSFPPITNSEISKMSLETTNLLIEVTSVTSYGVCRKVADTLLKEMLKLFGNSLMVKQVKNVDNDGNLKSVYPSRSDLIFDEASDIFVERQ